MLYDWFWPNPFLNVGGNDRDHFVSPHVSLLILCEMLVPGEISTALEWSVLRFAGKISFSMYLLHPRIVNSDFVRGQENYYTKFFTLWVFVFFWSTVSFYLVEYPSKWVAGWVGNKIKGLDESMFRWKKATANDTPADADEETAVSPSATFKPHATPTADKKPKTP